MSNNGHDPKLADSVANALAKKGAEHYGRYQQELRERPRGGSGLESPHARELDTGGFPIAQPNRSFAQRLARLFDPRHERWTP